MSYTVDFKKKFAGEFKNYEKDQRLKVLEFAQTVQEQGLKNFSIYPGKITPSWDGEEYSLDPVWQYAWKNDLWHYHIGLPEYRTVHNQYKTSDWVLHFQWVNKGRKIDLVDMCYHYTVDRKFYIPSAEYLE
jgi:hypothetical protein